MTIHTGGPGETSALLLVAQESGNGVVLLDMGNDKRQRKHRGQTPSIDLSLQRAREAAPATLSDAELAAALDWLRVMRDSLIARCVALGREQQRRQGQQLGWEKVRDGTGSREIPKALTGETL